MTDQIREQLKSSQYDFLRTNPDLKNIALLTLSGSHAYGTNNESSDIDLRGVLIEGKKHLLGFKPFEQFENKATDTVVFGLRKFISLCAKGNPNTLELLGTNEDAIVYLSEAGRKLKENAHLFFSRRVVGSFGNYANAQLRRLENALCHDAYDQDKKREHLATTLSKQIEHFNRSYKPLQKFHIYDDGDDLVFDVDLKKYPVKDFVNIYSEMSQIMRTYEKLDNRNKKKSVDHLNKHIMHLVRLLLTGEDILNGNGIITRRTAEHGFLMALRNGSYELDVVFTLIKAQQEKFAFAASRTDLPDNPDMDKIEQLMISLYEDNLRA